MTAAVAPRCAVPIYDHVPSGRRDVGAITIREQACGLRAARWCADHEMWVCSSHRVAHLTCRVEQR